jgi:two-component system OmpR family response regulator
VKILLVEDNSRVVEFVRKGLEEQGHTVDHAGNGRDGLFLAASEPYDAIILDRMLPGGIDGLGIIEALRRTGNRCPILILSSLSDVDERIRGLKAGGDDYLTKAQGKLAQKKSASSARAPSVSARSMPRRRASSFSLLPRRSGCNRRAASMLSLPLLPPRTATASLATSKRAAYPRRSSSSSSGSPAAPSTRC